VATATSRLRSGTVLLGLIGGSDNPEEVGRIRFLSRAERELLGLQGPRAWAFGRGQAFELHPRFVRGSPLDDGSGQPYLLPRASVRGMWAHHRTDGLLVVTRHRTGYYAPLFQRFRQHSGYAVPRGIRPALRALRPFSGPPAVDRHP
jgi:hypothetical protein